MGFRDDPNNGGAYDPNNGPQLGQNPYYAQNNQDPNQMMGGMDSRYQQPPMFVNPMPQPQANNIPPFQAAQNFQPGYVGRNAPTQPQQPMYQQPMQQPLYEQTMGQVSAQDYEDQYNYNYNQPLNQPINQQNQGMMFPNIQPTPAQQKPAQKKNSIFDIFRKKEEKKVVKSTQGSYLSILAPKSLDDVKGIISILRDGQPVIIDYNKIAEKDSQRIVDFISGAAYALGGTVESIGEKKFVVTPGGMGIVGNQFNE